MTGLLLGSMYIVALMATYYILWRREETRVKKDIQTHLDELKKQHVGE